MSSSDNAPLTPFQRARDMRVAVVRTLWNSHITEALLAGALDVFKGALDADMVDVFEVPGAVELTFAASKLIDGGLYDGVWDTPVICCVRTVVGEQDAVDGAGGRLGNKGAEAAQAALLMYDFIEKAENI